MIENVNLARSFRLSNFDAVTIDPVRAKSLERTERLVAYPAFVDARASVQLRLGQFVTDLFPNFTGQHLFLLLHSNSRGHFWNLSSLYETITQLQGMTPIVEPK